MSGFARHLTNGLFLIGVAATALAQPADTATREAPQERIAPQQDPRSLGLLIPSIGNLEAGDGRRVVTLDEFSQSVVAQLHCRVGDRSLVILPSGRLTSLENRQATVTDRPFEPLTAEELLERLHTGGFQHFKIATSTHYDYLYACQEGFYQVTRDILESLYDGVLTYLEQWKIPVQQPAVPLVVLIFPDRATFDAYKKMPPQVLAYYSAASNFVVLHEDPELSDAAPELALKQAAYTIAHEGVHQLLHNVGVQQRLAPWPAWLSEGLPELFCPIKISSSMVSEGSDSMPRRRVRWSKLGMVNDLRMHDLLKMHPAGGAVLEKAISSTRLDGDGYAMAWGIAHYLSTREPKEFQSYLREVSTTAPLADFPKGRNGRDRDLFVKHFGEDFAGLEADVAKYLTGRGMQSLYRDPQVYQTHYVVVHTAKRGRMVSITVYITTSPDGARAWRDKEQKEAAQSGLQHMFRTQACESRIQAENVVARIGKR
jgi:hypothetical protein